MSEQRRCKCGRATIGADWEESTDSLGRTVWRKAGSSRIVHICMDKVTAQLLRAKQQVGASESKSAEAAALFEQLRPALGENADPAKVALLERFVDQAGRSGDAGLRALEAISRMLIIERPTFAAGAVCYACGRDQDGAVPLKVSGAAAEGLAKLLYQERRVCTVEGCAKRENRVNAGPEDDEASA